MNNIEKIFSQSNNIQDFAKGYFNYLNNVFFSSNTEERIFADIFRLLNNSDDAILLESIHLNKSIREMKSGSFYQTGGENIYQKIKLFLSNSNSLKYFVIMVLGIFFTGLINIIKIIGISKLIKSRNISYEILVVDDRSQDNTVGVLENYIQTNPEVPIVFVKNKNYLGHHAI